MSELLENNSKSMYQSGFWKFIALLKDLQGRQKMQKNTIFTLKSKNYKKNSQGLGLKIISYYGTKTCMQSEDA